MNVTEQSKLVSTAMPGTVVQSMMRKVFWANFLALLGLLTLSSSQSALAQESPACAPLNEETRGKIIHNVARSAHTEPLVPTIEEEKLVEGTCYRKLSLSVANSNRRLTLYLSPDTRFVSSTLLDVSVDPWAAEAQQSEQLARQAEKDQTPVRGPNRAPITIVVFSDFQCPYCSTFSEMIERYRKANPDRTRLLFRNLPLPVHDWAMSATRAGVCISQQSSSAFWKFHDLLLSKQKNITTETLPSTISGFLAGTPDVLSEPYARCMDSALPQQRLDQDLAEARSLNLDATPTIFINGRKYTGFRDDAALTIAINVATTSVSSKEASTAAAKN